MARIVNMDKKRIQSVAIIGGGPSGSALACHLSTHGIAVALYDDGVRPELVVGESLIPAILPMLDRLGVRERVAAIAQHKPGASFVFSPEHQIHFNFQAVRRCGLPTFAYNVPRDHFDRVLSEHAAESGATVVRKRAQLVRAGRDSVALTAESLAAAPVLKGNQPDLIVDATGRSRHLAHLLEIPAAVGPRKDTAYFAHYEDFDMPQPPGQVIITRLKVGWSWRIPLPGRLSVGVVIQREEAARLGATPEERLEAAIDRDPSLSVAGRSRRRVTKVAAYSNYQLISERGYGEGWAKVGDAFGFVDPMLSPGLMLALRSAELLADHINDLPAYDQQMRQWLAAWQELVEYFYNGQIFAMYHTGLEIQRKLPSFLGVPMQRHIERHIACMASGATTTQNYPRRLVDFLARRGSWMADPADLAIA